MFLLVITLVSVAFVEAQTCPLMKCVSCKSGYRLDDDGCQTCNCVDPCEYPNCKEGEVCKSQEVQCIRAPCYPVAECTNICPQIRCSISCESGYRKDSKGCQTCQCVDVCEGVKCSKGQVCKKVVWPCLIAPCPVRGKCYNISQVCPQIRCSIACESGYRKNSKGCQTCQCVDVCEGVKCSDGQVCKEVVWPCLIPPCPVHGKCYNISQVCPRIACFAPCKSGYAEDFNRCLTCECVDPCEHVKCSEGQICKKKVSPCLIPPCPQHGECYNTTSV